MKSLLNQIFSDILNSFKNNEINFDRMRQFINVLERQIEITIYIDDK